MSHYLEFDDQRRPWAISSYLLIYPFTFNRVTGDLDSQPTEAWALFGLAATGRPGRHTDPQYRPQTTDFRLDSPETRNKSCDFKVLNDDAAIANLKAFDVYAVSTPSSLDMSRAVIVAHASNNPNTGITTTPLRCVYDEFGADRGIGRYWGAELSTSNGIILRASLSVPTYQWNTGFLKEYVALGPANSRGSDGSIFNWLVNQDRWLPTLTIGDVVSQVKNKLFGGDDSGRAQVKQASGAVFMMNGPLVHVRWRTLVRFIRNVAGPARQDAVDLINLFPETMLDQSVYETHMPDVVHGRRELGVSTQDFEGIMIWGLTRRDGEEAPLPLHG